MGANDGHPLCIRCLPIEHVLAKENEECDFCCQMSVRAHRDRRSKARRFVETQSWDTPKKSSRQKPAAAAGAPDQLATNEEEVNLDDSQGITLLDPTHLDTPRRSAGEAAGEDSGDGHQGETGHARSISPLSRSSIRRSRSRRESSSDSGSSSDSHRSRSRGRSRHKRKKDRKHKKAKRRRRSSSSSPSSSSSSSRSQKRSFRGIERRIAREYEDKMARHLEAFRALIPSGTARGGIPSGEAQGGTPPVLPAVPDVPPSPSHSVLSHPSLAQQSEGSASELEPSMDASKRQKERRQYIAHLLKDDPNFILEEEQEKPNKDVFALFGIVDDRERSASALPIQKGIQVRMETFAKAQAKRNVRVSGRRRYDVDRLFEKVYKLPQDQELPWTRPHSLPTEFLTLVDQGKKTFDNRIQTFVLDPSTELGKREREFRREFRRAQTGIRVANSMQLAMAASDRALTKLSKAVDTFSKFDWSKTKDAPPGMMDTVLEITESAADLSKVQDEVRVNDSDTFKLWGEQYVHAAAERRALWLEASGAHEDCKRELKTLPVQVPKNATPDEYCLFGPEGRRVINTWNDADLKRRQAVLQHKAMSTSHLQGYGVQTQSNVGPKRRNRNRRRPWDKSRKPNQGQQKSFPKGGQGKESNPGPSQPTQGGRGGFRKAGFGGQPKSANKQ